MKGFIEKVAAYLFDTYGERLGDLLVVVPNRRAGLFFRQAFADLISKPLWAPDVLAIRDLLERITGTAKADDLQLLWELYRSYRTVTTTEESFEKFFPWGEMLLADFDDIDKYLVNARDLFRNLAAVRELAADLSYLSEEQVELIRRFWEHFPTSGRKHAALFLRQWEQLDEVYRLFREGLQRQELATEGMLYREVAVKCSEEAGTGTLPGPVCFAGFNLLTPAERVLFRAMKEEGKAIFFWDYDLHYLPGYPDARLAGHDAGRAIATYLKELPPPVDLGIFDNLTSPDKNIRVWSSPDRATQAFVVKKVLEEWYPHDREGEEQRTAVVLADEQLLLPVLHALPPTIPEVNVTMGFPVKASPVFTLFRDALQLLSNSKVTGDGTRLYYYKDVLALLHNPLLEPATTDLTLWEKEIREQNRIYLAAARILVSEELSALLRMTEEPEHFSRSLTDLIHRLLSRREGNADDESIDLNLEVLYRLFLLVNRFNDFVDRLDQPLSSEGYLRLLIRLAEREHVAFYGEPLTGLQVMGVLETRLLDFERVLVVSVNEGNLPRSSNQNSYIPYNLRKGFGLPVWEQQDGLYAYYFFRLIQRAREVVLVYHTEASNGMTGEPSRFIEQLRYFLGREIRVRDLAYHPGLRHSGTITVEKDTQLLQRLQQLFAGPEEKYLSPTAINTYLTCRLRFYFRYVAGIREPDEMAEEIDHALFGSMIHHALEIIYDPDASHHPPDGMITSSWLEQMKNQVVDRAIDRAMDELLYHGEKPPTEQTGPLHHITRTMIRNYVLKVLEHDRSGSPFRVLGVEQKVRDSLRIVSGDKELQVRIGGTIDRVDEIEGMVRIIDYKTGGGKEKTRYPAIGELFDRSKGKNRDGEFLQILLYARMYGGDRPVRPALYFIRRMFGGVDPRQTVRTPYHFDDQKNRELTVRLMEMLEEMFAREVPFDQTPDEAVCEHCPYRGICEKG